MSTFVYQECSQLLLILFLYVPEAGYHELPHELIRDDLHLLYESIPS